MLRSTNGRLCHIIALRRLLLLLLLLQMDHIAGIVLTLKRKKQINNEIIRLNVKIVHLIFICK